MTERTDPPEPGTEEANLGTSAPGPNAAAADTPAAPDAAAADTTAAPDAAAADTTAAPEPPPASSPVVAWEAPASPSSPPPGQASIGSYAGGDPPFSLGGLLADTFARYGADPIRFFVLAAAASVLSFAGTILSLPFGAGAPARGADASGVVGLLSFVVGIVTSSAMFALAEGGPSMPFGRVLRRGVERAGWLFLTSIIVGLGLFVVFLVAAIPVVVLGLLSPTAALFALVPVILVFFWLGIRIALALPANVADNRNSIDALKVSWRATGPSGVWLRVVGAALLLGLLVLPASAGALFLVFLGMFGGQPLLVIAMSLLLAFFTPLTALLTYSAYRRLVPPLQPSWTGTPTASPATPPPSDPDAAAPPQAAAPPNAAAPTQAAAAPDAAAPTQAAAAPDAAAPPQAAAPPEAPIAPTPAAFRVPPFDTAAKALLALVLVLDVAGVAAIPYVVGEAIAGRIDLPRFPGSRTPFPGTGNIEQGDVAFGSSGSAAGCSIDDRTVFADAGEPLTWVAVLDRAVEPADVVLVEFAQDGVPRRQEPQPPGAYSCLVAPAPERFDAGLWTVEVTVNGESAALGVLIVQ